MLGKIRTNSRQLLGSVLNRIRQILGFVFVVIVGGPVCFFAVMAFIAVVSPSSVLDREVAIFVAILSVEVAIVVCYFVWPAVSLKVSRFEKIANDEPSLRLGIQDLRMRSRWYRLMSMFVLFLTVTVALLGFTVAARSIEQQLLDGKVSGALAALVLLVVLIRILSSIYRYNLRLSSFYDARADYLCLACDVKVKALSHKELLELVSTDELDTTSIRKFWHSLFGRSSSQEDKNRKPSSRNGNVEPGGDG